MATIASSSDPIFRTTSPRRLAPRKELAFLPATPPVTPGQRATDARLAAILDAPLAAGETAFDGYRAKEVQLVGVLAQLSVLDARALHARLANPLGSDALAAKFMRLTVERRVRLLHFLADARRRAALAGK